MKLVTRHLFSESTAAFPIEWEETDCPLCNGKESTILLEGQDPLPGERGLWFAVVRCAACGLCFTNPRPSPESIGEFYPDDYGPHQTDGGKSKRQYGGLPRWLARKHGRIALPASGKLLDFGCGGGRFLEQMRQQGWDVTGVDISAATAARMRDERGLHVLAGSLPHPALEAGTFDVVTMWQSLEHVHAPGRVLAAARELLVADGKLIVAVPNINSLPYRLFGANWYALDVPRHLTHFSPKTLAAMLKKCGFHVESLRMVCHSSWLRMSARRACRMKRSMGRTMPTLLQTRCLSRLVSWCSSMAGQSDAMVAVAVKR